MENPFAWARSRSARWFPILRSRLDEDVRQQIHLTLLVAGIREPYSPKTFDVRAFDRTLRRSLYGMALDFGFAHYNGDKSITDVHFKGLEEKFLNFRNWQATWMSA